MAHLGKSDEDGDDEDEDEDEIEPIRINYNDIQSIDDLLSKVNRQPGNRKILFENLPNRSTTIVLQESSNSPRNPPLKSEQSAEILIPSSRNPTQDDDSSSPPKSLLKTSQNPSALDTSTKTSSFHDDQIHVNIENAQGISHCFQLVFTDLLFPSIEFH